MKDIKVYFRNKSNNEEQGIASVIQRTSSFLTEPISFPGFSTVPLYGTLS